MTYRKSLLLYRDDPPYGLFLKVIMVIVPLLLLASAVYLQSTGEQSGALILVLETLLVGLVFWLVFPRSYRVYEDHLSIVLGGPLAVRVPFDRITAVEATTRTALTVNFVTRMARMYVVIRRTGGMSIAITPESNELFVQHANLALSNWKRTSRETRRRPLR